MQELQRDREGNHDGRASVHDKRVCWCQLAQYVDDELSQIAKCFFLKLAVALLCRADLKQKIANDRQYPEHTMAPFERQILCGRGRQRIGSQARGRPLVVYPLGDRQVGAQ